MSYQFIFALRLEWNIFFLFICLLLVVLHYFLFHFKQEKSNSHSSYFFIAGISLLYILTGTPIAIWSHLTFITHMLQMSLLFFIIPPLLLLGIPKKYYQTIQRQLEKKMKLDPAIFIVIFAFFLYIYHTPAFLNIITEQKSYHDWFIWFMFLMSLMNWIPLISYRINEKIYIEKNYMKINIWLITPACLLFILLPSQSASPLLNQMLNLCLPLSGKNILIKPLIDIQIDQQFAGFLMFFIHKGGIVLMNKLGNTY